MVAEFLWEHFGIKTSNYSIYREALRHKSAHTVRNGMKSNERLEFLGDAMLEIVVSDYLYHKYTDGSEGDLTKLRSKIVSRKNLNEVGSRIGITQMLSKSSRIKVKNSSVGGNALEALVGAIYLEKGFEKTKRIVSERLLNDLMSVEELEQKEENFKSVLLEWCQKYSKQLSYVTVEKADNQGFQSKVIIDGQELSSGTGRNKKSAEQDAAKEATDLLNIKV